MKKIAFSKNKEEISVTKHGHMALEINYSTCPECFEIISEENITSAQHDVLVEKRSFNEYYDILCYKCSHCGCEYQKKILKKRVFSWKKGKGKVFISLAILSLIGIVLSIIFRSSSFSSFLAFICFVILFLVIGLFLITEPRVKTRNKIYAGINMIFAIGLTIGVFLFSYFKLYDVGTTLIILSACLLAFSLMLWILDK